MMLEGMKILSFVHGLYGGSASQILADLGAEVVRVEWDMTGYLVRLSETKKEDEKAWKDWIFVEKDELKGQYPLPNAFQAYRKFIK